MGDEVKEEKLILIVDDEIDILSQMKLALTQEGFLVKSATNGNEGLEVFKTHRPDICILDFKMPGLNGLDLLREIKKIDPKCEVLLISGHADMRVAVRAIKEHAFDFLQKPIDLTELIFKINEVLNGMIVKSKYEGSFGGGLIYHKVGEYFHNVSEISINMDLDEYVAPKLRKEFEKLEDNKMLQTHVAISLGKVNRINNVGLNTLIDIYDKSKKNGYKVAFLNLSAPVKEYFKILGYDKYFNILKPDPDSLANFSND
jgi:anti-anti-sigma factor